MPQVQNTVSTIAATDGSDQERQAPGSEKPKQQDAGDSHADDNELGLSFLRNMVTDQRTIWTSPFHLRLGDATWLLPLAEVTGGFFATDRATARAISNDSAGLRPSRDLSNYGVAAFVGASGGLYVLGKVARDDHKKETGVLATEAILDSLAVNVALEYSLGREEPYRGQGNGLFFRGGASFPSNHSVIAWSTASVIAHEYPSVLTQILSYGLATAVTASRVTGKEHFPSDVVVGSAIGWFIGREVYRKHHDPELGGGGWKDLSGGVEAEEHRSRRNMGSPFVPLDSWVYPTLERLAALGYISSSIAGMEPWTRIECARLTEEAREGLLQNQPANPELAALEDRLQLEFEYESNLLSGGRNLTANLDSIYSRAVSISGPDLNDSYHFGQTISYDYGRPFERGTNLQDGGSFSAAAGPVTFSIRAEFQHAPSAPPFSADVRNFIGAIDQVPVPPDTPTLAINRPELLDTYLAVNLDNFEIVLGRQSLSWGPGPGGSLLWSDNIEPVNMVRLVNPEPFRLPGFLSFLGPVRADEFFGRLSGHDFIRRPFIYGQKISFKPLPSLELGFGRTVTIGGQGPGATPITTDTLVHSFFGQELRNSIPGDRHTNMDWTFYVPKVHNYLVFYGELFAEDNFLPIENPARNPFRPGIFITHFPGISKLDLHVEATSTESPGQKPANDGRFNYYNSQYRDGYTNGGNLIGNAVGRMGQAYQGWLTYWVSPRSSVQLTYKNSRVDGAFVPGGGAWQDYSVQHEIYLRSGFYLKSRFQFEDISRYPILFGGPERNYSAIVEAGFVPGRRN
jgi:membrane-associated phospholipid phosphatase